MCFSLALQYGSTLSSLLFLESFDPQRQKRKENHVGVPYSQRQQPAGRSTLRPAPLKCQSHSFALLSPRVEQDGESYPVCFKKQLETRTQRPARMDGESAGWPGVIESLPEEKRCYNARMPDYAWT